VIDIGSNSGRVVVYRRDGEGRLRLQASTRAALRLVREVDRGHLLGPEAIARTLGALRDFRALARGKGATRVLAVATAAVRDAADGPALLQQVRRELGFSLRVLDGAEEARYGFLGALHGLPIEHGILFDLGGGSLQLTRFRARRASPGISLPLGALRLSQAFLRLDPPTRAQRRALRRHVAAQLASAGFGPLGPNDVLVGTGGTLRNLAKIDRRAHGYPLPRVHGYALEATRLDAVLELLAGRRQKRREAVPGLSQERGDSIVGGAEAIATLMRVCGSPRVLVSGQGVREGLAFGLLAPDLPSVAAVRAAALASLGARFDGWDAVAAARRAGLAGGLARVLLADASPELRAAVDLAARLLDVGRTLDFFDRHEHAAEIVLTSDLDGYSHRELALVAAVLRRAGDEGSDPAQLRPLIGDDERPALERAALVLALADDLEERCTPGAALKVRVRRGPDTVTVTLPQLLGWRERPLDGRFRRAFRRRLVVRGRTD
jgi:exopolyphosphatase/guanosine-5'-triphosphate,3'-diphosphate pyrophosphatase